MVRPRLFWLVAVLALVMARSAGGQNLIPDPTFSSGLSTWRPRGAPLTTALAWNPVPGADGAPGFATLTGVGPGAFFAGVCLPASGGAVYSWGGFLRLQAPFDFTAQFTVLFFANASCEGPSGLLRVDGPTLDASSGSPDAWHLRAGPDVVAPTLTESVAFEVNGTSPNTLRSVDFDNVYFGPQGTAPPTAAAGVPTLSALASGIFALLLAVAGAWRVLKV